jgi:hypothetical protein
VINENQIKDLKFSKCIWPFLSLAGDRSVQSTDFEKNLLINPRGMRIEELEAFNSSKAGRDY